MTLAVPLQGFFSLIEEMCLKQNRVIQQQPGYRIHTNISVKFYERKIWERRQCGDLGLRAGYVGLGGIAAAGHLR